MGGVSRNTQKYNRAVRDTHVDFCRQKLIGEGVRFGNQLIEQYRRWLDDIEYASRSIYLEIAKRDEGTKMASAELKLAEICLC